MLCIQGGLKTSKITISFKHLVIMVLLYIQNRNPKKINQISNFKLPGSQFENLKNLNKSENSSFFGFLFYIYKRTMIIKCLIEIVIFDVFNPPYPTLQVCLFVCMYVPPLPKNLSCITHFIKLQADTQYTASMGCFLQCKQ